jgi:ATP diphosphatase
LAEIDHLLAIMRRLRDPETGCPWDIEQNFHTIAPYTIEEAYEVADTIERQALDELKGELGDLLFQVVFHAQMAQEQGLFEFNDVVHAIADKLERRHPHVFGDANIDSAQAQTLAWEQHKEQERAHGSATPPSVLDGVAVALPGLTRAVKLTKRASRVGFDWPDILPVFDQIEEELEEVREEVIAKAGHHRLEDEIGDLLFAVCNLARHAHVDPETAVRGANAKFERRFHWIEQQLTRRGKTVKETPLDDLDYLWEQSKEALAEKIATDSPD